jgi:hypothetical protein
MEYLAGRKMYFPEGFHDYYFVSLLIDFRTRSLTVGFELPDSKNMRVNLIFEGVTKYSFVTGDEEDITSNDIWDCEEDLVAKKIVFTGREGWKVGVQYTEASWEEVDAPGATSSTGA